MHKILHARHVVAPLSPSAPQLDHHPDAYLHRRLCALATECTLPFGAEVSLAQRIRAMVGRDGNIDAPDDQHNTPLHVIAGRSGNAERNALVMVHLLEGGATVNARNRDGLTPLHVAASGRDPMLVKILLAHGADRLALDKQQRCPVELAQLVETADLLI